MKKQASIFDNVCLKCNQMLLPDATHCWWCKAPVVKPVVIPEKKSQIIKRNLIKLGVYTLEILSFMATVFFIASIFIFGATLGSVPIGLWIFSFVIIHFFGVWLDYKLFRNRNIYLRIFEWLIGLNYDKEW